MKNNFRMPQNAISVIVREVCEAIIEAYKDEVITCPSTPEEWKTIAEQFKEYGTSHIVIRRPNNSGSLYHNYKCFFSLVLLGLVDPITSLHMDWHRRFWSYVRFLNLRWFRTKRVHLKWYHWLATTRQASKWWKCHTLFYTLGDDIFALRTYLMKPYSKRFMNKEQWIFNYRI